jgi:hypothetical protein
MPREEPQHPQTARQVPTARLRQPRLTPVRLDFTVRVLASTTTSARMARTAHQDRATRSVVLVVGLALEWLRTTTSRVAAGPAGEEATRNIRSSIPSQDLDNGNGVRRVRLATYAWERRTLRRPPALPSATATSAPRGTTVRQAHMKSSRAQRAPTRSTLELGARTSA